MRRPQRPQLNWEHGSAWRPATPTCARLTCDEDERSERHGEEVGHGSFLRRIAINVGAGYVPGINAVIMGAALAAGELGWEMVGIRDGFDGLLHPDRYPEGGLVSLSPELIENLDPAGGGLLGQSVRVDPFHVRKSMTTTWSRKSTSPMIS